MPKTRARRNSAVSRLSDESLYVTHLVVLQNSHFLMDGVSLAGGGFGQASGTAVCSSPRLPSPATSVRNRLFALDTIRRQLPYSGSQRERGSGRPDDGGPRFRPLHKQAAEPETFDFFIFFILFFQVTVV